MNWVKILHAVEKGFPLHILVSIISLTLFCFAGSFALQDWYIVSRVLCILMLKIYRFLSIPVVHSGERHMKMDSTPSSSHMTWTSARLHVYKTQTSLTTKRPPPPLANCTHTHERQIQAEHVEKSPRADVRLLQSYTINEHILEQDKRHIVDPDKILYWWQTSARTTKKHPLIKEVQMQLYDTP